MWSFVAAAFSWPVVEPVLGQGYLIVGHFFQLTVLGKELADKAVEVFAVPAQKPSSPASRADAKLLSAIASGVCRKAGTSAGSELAATRFTKRWPPLPQAWAMGG